MSPETIDLGALLTIDVGSELRKLSSAQLQGPWQIPAEVCRRALRNGARRVEVRTRRGGVDIVDDGAPITPEILRATAALLRSGASNEQRHAALTALEHAGGLALLAICGLSRKRLTVDVETNDERFVLHADDKNATLSSRPPTGTRRNQVRVDAPALDRRQVRTWLQDVGRFDGGRIRVDGEPIRSAWTNMLVDGPLDAPLSGHVGLPRDGETAHIWLLEHGIVTGHFAVPDAPVFDAAVELGSEATDLSAARLRETVVPHVTRVVTGAVRLACAYGSKTRDWHPDSRARFARLLLNAARRRIESAAVVQVPIFRVVDGPHDRLASMVELRAATTEGNTLQALYPTQDPAGFALAERLTLVADATERSGLAEVLGVRFRPPNPRERGRTVRAALKTCRDSIERAANRLRHPFGATPVDPAELDESERGFTLAINRQLRSSRTPRSVELCEGAGPIRTVGPNATTLRLPRRNPIVRAAIEAVARDPRWTYPACLAVLDGHGLPSLQERNAWRDSTP